MAGEQFSSVLRQMYRFFRIRNAIHHHNLEKVKALVTDDPDLLHKTDRNGWSALHIASYYDASDILTYLLTQGLSADIKDLHGVTPLHVAVEEGNANAVRILLENGADVRIPYMDMWSPFHLAAAAGHPDVVDALAETDIGQINDPDELLLTPLHCAAEGGHLRTAERLVHHGAKLDAVDNRGRTPLATAREAEHERIAAFLEGATEPQ